MPRSTSPHDSEASIIFGKGVTSKPGSAHILVLAVDVATLADLLHETAEHYDHYEKTHAQHNWWNWYEQVTIIEVSYGGNGAVAVSTARK